jgi:hypothetical protein
MAHLSKVMMDRFAMEDPVSPKNSTRTTYGGFPLPSSIPELDLPSTSPDAGRSHDNGRPRSLETHPNDLANSAILNNLPLDFLSVYPFPAFVLQLPVSIPNAETDPTSSVDIPFTRNAWSGKEQAKGPFEPIWSNERYAALSRGTDFLDMIDTRQFAEFADWVSGVSDFEQKKEKRSWMRRDPTKRSIRTVEERDSTTQIRTTLQAYEVASHTQGKVSNLDDMDSVSQLDAVEEVISPGGDPYIAGDLLDGIKEQVERDREAFLGSRSSILDIEEEVQGSSTFEITFRPILSDSEERTLAFTLTKTQVAITPPNETASYVVIQAIPTSRSRDALSESPMARFGGSDQSFRPNGPSTGMSTTATLQNAHRHSFPFFTQNDEEGSETPGISTFRTRRRIEGLRRGPSDTDIDEDKTPSLSSPGARYLDSEVSGLFPPSEPVVLGAADLEQLTSGPRKSILDITSVEYLLQNTDWSKTSLGPRSQWSQSLRTMLSLVQALPLQATLWWGPELVLLYNEHYAKMIGGKHPNLFGMSGPRGYAEVWSALGPVAKTVMSGIPASQDDDLFLFESNDPETPLLEYYHSCESSRSPYRLVT